MAKNDDLDAKEIEARVHDLSKSMERMKSQQADRDDVVVELKQSQHTRLELLARDLQSVFEQVPDDVDQFEFALTNGDTPRLWIDMTTHARMGPDRHQYELVKDTKLGRTILASSHDRIQIGGIITDYVADKILERERLIEGEWVLMSGYDFDGEQESTESSDPVVSKRSGWRSLMWFGLGAIASVSALVAWVWFAQPPTFLQ